MSRMKRRSHHFTPIVVARNDEHRHRQFRECIGDFLIFLVQTAIGQVAGRDHAIGRGIERGDRRDRIAQHRVGIDAAIGQHTGWPHVEVRDLRDDHCAFIKSIVSLMSRSYPAFASISPRMIPVMISRCARHVRTELPPG